MIAGNFVLVFTTAAVLVLAELGLLNAILLSALIILFATSYLIVYSNAAALVLGPHGDIAGHTASIYGFAGQIGSALIVSLLVLQIDSDLVRWSSALLAICAFCLAAASWWMAARLLSE